MAIFEPIESTGESRTYNIKSPVTLESIGEFTAASDEEVRQAVARARAAQPAWAALTFPQRAEYLWRLVDTTVRRMDEIIEIVLKETGKTKNEAIMMEAIAACMSMSHYAKRAEKYLQTTQKRPSGLQRFTKKVTLTYQPLGVVGLITPWNGPVALTANPFAQAVMAGNTVVHKPSEVTPFSAKLFEELTKEAGFPEGVYQVIQGDGATGAALLDAGIDKVSFTGSVATGRKVGETCGRNLIPCTLELGGNDAMIVCSDADLDRAADGALRGSFFNTGHYCCGTERVYVPASIYDAFVQKVVDQASKLKQSATEEGDVGAVFWDRQMDIIEAHMSDARAKGAKVLLGGDRRTDMPGYFFPPTVVTEVENSMDLMTKETFGPIIAIQKVEDEEEAIDKANDSDFGLSGTVWTTDLDKGLEIGKRIVTGSISVNDISVTYGIPEAPFGGLKASGVGQVNGEVGIRGYCHLHPVILDTAKKSQGGYPYTEKSAAGMEKFAKFLFGNRFLRRLIS